jgi:hypothetical protein
MDHTSAGGKKQKIALAKAAYPSMLVHCRRCRVVAAFAFARRRADGISVFPKEEKKITPAFGLLE